MSTDIIFRTKITRVPSKDTDHSARTLSLITVFVEHSVGN